MSHKTQIWINVVLDTHSVELDYDLAILLFGEQGKNISPFLGRPGSRRASYRWQSSF